MYGNAQVWQRVFIRDCFGHGMWTEASSAFSYSSTDWRAQEEGFFDDVVVRNVGLDAWVDAGPHDSQVTSFISYNHGMQGATACHTLGSGELLRLRPDGRQRGDRRVALRHAPPLHLGQRPDGRLHRAEQRHRAAVFGFRQYQDRGAGNRIASLFLLSCGSDSTSPVCLDIASSSNNIGQIYGTWYFGTLPTGQTMVKIESGSGTGGNIIGAFQGSSIASTVASNTLLSVQGSFNTVTANTGQRQRHRGRVRQRGGHLQQAVP